MPLVSVQTHKLKGEIKMRKLNIEINKTEQDFLNKIEEKFEEIREIRGEIIDTRDICEKIEEIDEIITEINEYNDDNFNEEEQEKNGISDDFIDSINKYIEDFKNNEMNLNELEYISDFKYGVTLYDPYYFNIIDYLNEMGFDIPDFLIGHINEETLIQERMNEVDFMGKTYYYN